MPVAADAFERGEALYRMGDLAAAERCYIETLRAEPRHYGALYQLGILALRSRRMREAAEAFALAIAARPEDAHAHNSRGTALEQLGRLEDAVTEYRAAIARAPGLASAHANCASALRRLRRYDEALAMCDRAVALDVDFAAGHANRGNVLRELGRPVDALAAYDRAIELAPNFAAAYSNRGLALRDLGRFADALVSCDRAIALHAGFADACNNRGTVLSDLGRDDEAIAAFERAIALAPGDANYRFNQSLTLLAAGQYRQGWALHESRWRSAQLNQVKLPPGRPWRGDAPIDGKTILVLSEQGLGDSLQFCRYVPLLAARSNVILRVEWPLVRLLSGLAGARHVVATGEPLPPFDAWIPMLSLPLAFNTEVGTIPADVPYLRADPRAVAAWRARLAGLPGRKIGLVWAGASRPDQPRANYVDQRRSIALDLFAPLASVADVCLVSLQKGNAAARAATKPSGMVVHDWTAELTDFADTAALVEALDLVISVDTSVVHLAGALGRPVWVLNRYDQCWRWLRDRTDSPWYPTARLFRQHAPGEWSGAIDDVVDALRAWR